MDITKWNSETYKDITAKDVCEVLTGVNLINGNNNEFIIKVRDEFDTSLGLQKIFYAIIVQKDFWKVIIHIKNEKFVDYSYEIATIYKFINSEQYGNFGLPIDRRDMEALVKSYTPTHEQMDLNLFTMSGYYVGGWNDRWEWTNLSILPTHELYLLYIYMKYDPDIIQKYNTAGALNWFINAKAISLIHPEWMIEE